MAKIEFDEERPEPKQTPAPLGDPVVYNLITQKPFTIDRYHQIPKGTVIGHLTCNFGLQDHFIIGGFNRWLHVRAADDEPNVIADEVDKPDESHE